MKLLLATAALTLATLSAHAQTTVNIYTSDSIPTWSQPAPLTDAQVQRIQQLDDQQFAHAAAQIDARVHQQMCALGYPYASRQECQ